MAMSVMDEGAKLNIMKALNLLGHSSKDMTRVAPKEMVWILMRSSKTCETCATGKTKQKNVPTESRHKGEQHLPRYCN
jgi:hypothetical protein